MKTNALVAIDIALLLPEVAAARVKAVNAALLAARPEGSEGLRFDATHLPHITLVQMFVQRASLPALIDRIDPILRPLHPLALRVTGVGSSTTAAHFVIEPNHTLQGLHEQLMHAVQPFEESGGDVEAFYSNGESPREEDVAWVARFRANSSYRNFYPHVTLGLGPPPEFHEPFEFTAGCAALCHLGRFCTCRIVLREWRLGSGGC